MDIPPAWQEAAARWLTQGGLTLVLGATDSGKSTLCRYLLDRVLGSGEQAAWIDADLGQSHLGPPTTLGLHFYPPGDPGADPLHPDATYFIGTTSPVGRLLEIIVGLRRLVGHAHQRGVKRLLVNTSGLVFGPVAQRLKGAKLEIFNPHLILALEQARELEELLAPWQFHYRGALMRLPVSSRAQAKTSAQRRLYRQARLSAYFRGACRQVRALDQWDWLGVGWGQGLPLTQGQREKFGAYLMVRVLYGEIGASRLFLVLEQSPPAAGSAALNQELRTHRLTWVSWRSLKLRLVGLLGDDLLNRSLGLLLPSPWQKGHLALWTPAPPEILDQIRFCRLGRMHLTLQGHEMAR